MPTPSDGEVAIFSDVVGSTRQQLAQGTAISRTRAYERLDQVLRTFREADPDLWTKKPDGDGQLIVAHAAKVASLVTAAMQIQVQRGLDVTIAMGTGYLRWWPDNEPFSPSCDDVSGDAVNLVSRLKGVCPPRGTLLNAGVYDLLEDDDHLRELFIEQTAQVKDLGSQTFWIMTLRPRRVVTDELAPASADRAGGIGDMFRFMTELYHRAEARDEKNLNSLASIATSQERIAGAMAALGKTVERVEASQRRGFAALIEQQRTGKRAGKVKR